MWFPFSPTKCCGRAGRIPEVLSSNLGPEPRYPDSGCSLFPSAPPDIDGILDEFMLWSLLPKFFSVFESVIILPLIGGR